MLSTEFEERRQVRRDRLSPRTVSFYAETIHAVAEILGHESTEVTLRYIGVDIDDMRAAMNEGIFA